jgi:hypothetical protein
LPDTPITNRSVGDRSGVIGDQGVSS